VPACVSSLFPELISACPNSMFQFTKTHLAELGVGGTQLKLHNFHLVF
jgi:hypothetical protein